jgi:2-dehydropantoate 2-reductase
MRIAVLGSGAMGSVMGGLLAEAGNDVSLIDVDRTHMDAVAGHGLTMVTADGDERVVPVAATSDATSLAGPVELVLVMTKTFSTTEAVASVVHLTDEDTWWASAQNGLGSGERIAAGTSSRRVLSGTTTVGAVLTEPGVVQMSAVVSTGKSITRFGPFDGVHVNERAHNMAAAFTEAGMKTEIDPDVDTMIWTKLCMAGTAAPLTALVGYTIADLITDDTLMATWRALLSENFSVAAAEGVNLDRDLVTALALETYRNVGAHRASMAVDTAARRRTEIDAMCGEVARRGVQVGVATPVNSTVYALVLALESTF